MTRIRAGHRAGLLLLTAALLLLAACARTPPVRYYLLAGPTAAATDPSAETRRIGLGPVRLPQYLDRPQIVRWASPTRLQLSQQHRWAEPLQDSFTRALAAHLDDALPAARVLPWPARGTPRPDARLAVDVQRFEATADGGMVLEARWTYSRGTSGAKPLEAVSVLREAVSGEPADYDALVAAASAAVAALARDIAARLPAE
jgi:uncharacterized lipoprotein YmbA